MNSAFLVFDLVGRNAGSEGQRFPQSLINPRLDDSEETVGLIVRIETQSSSGR